MFRDPESAASGRRGFAGAAAAIALAISGAGVPARATPPDIVMIVIDDVGVDQLAAYGEAFACSTNGRPCSADADCPDEERCLSDFPNTPTIDQIAREGLLFRNAWASATCRPARATILTGRHGFRNGLLHNPQKDLSFEELTIAEILLDADLNPHLDYDVAGIGKWHLGGGELAPNLQGFPHFAGALRNIGIGNGQYFNWERTVNGVTEDCFEGSTVCPGSPYATSVQVDDAIAWLAGAEGPLFLYFSFSAAHVPRQVPPYDLVSPATLARLPLDNKGELQPPGYECVGPGEARPCYLAMLEAVDAEIGRLLDALVRPATVILLGDNGTPEAVVVPPFQPEQAKATMYEGGINVPLIIRDASGAGAGTESEALVHTVDLLPTILDWVGGNLPLDREIDGLSLVPLQADPTATLRAILYADWKDAKTVRDDRFKLIYRPDYEELYDLTGSESVRADPFEQNDLLLGTCSSTSAIDCHVDGDCPGTQFCVPPSLSLEAEEARTVLRQFLDGFVDQPAGEVSDGSGGRGPLHLSKIDAGWSIELTWDRSCFAGDVDYAVYEGHLGSFTSTVPRACTTSFATQWSGLTPSGNAFYLVVPHNGWREGSYGSSGTGESRPASAEACFIQQVAATCE